MTTPSSIVALGALPLPDAPDAEVVPEWIQICPPPPFAAYDGRGPWTFSDGDALIRASMDAPGRIHIDENHSTMTAAKDGMSAPARGYVTAMEMRDGAIWGRVDWTEAGHALVKDRAYWGISPVFTFEQSTGRVTRIVNVALTNDPALRALATLNSANMENGMNFLQQIAELLGLAADASETAVLSALRDKLASPDTDALAQLRTALGAEATATATELVATATALRSTGTSATAQIAALQAKVTALEQTNKDRASEAWLAAKRAEGIGIPAGKDDVFIALHREDPARAEEVVAMLPNLGSTPTADTPPGGDVPDSVAALSAEARAVARMLGQKDEDMLAALKADSAAKEAV